MPLELPDGGAYRDRVGLALQSTVHPGGVHASLREVPSFCKLLLKDKHHRLLLALVRYSLDTFLSENPSLVLLQWAALH